jgi:subtilisin family serine protease
MIRSDVPTVGRRMPPPPKRPEYVPGALVVKIKDEVVAGVPDVRSASTASLRRAALPEATAEPFRELRRRNQIKEITPVFARDVSSPRARASTAAAFAVSVRDSESEDLAGINLLRMAKSADLEKLEKEIASTPGIEYVHRVPARWAAGAAPAALPVDPLVNRQWGLRAIRWFDTRSVPDASAVKVAVLDTGIDTDHPDLEESLSTYNHNPASAEDIVGHGTHVSGIICATINNKVGIAGICRCELHVWKIFGDAPADDGEFYVDELMYQRALNQVRTAGMNVVNLSIGGTLSSRTEALLFRRLRDAGVAVVAAMGNEYREGNPTEYPAAYPGSIAVGAINESNRRAAFSNTGNHIVVCAPGNNILSTLPMKPSAYRTEEDTEYAAWSGTSMATPHVTAAAALILAGHPDWKAGQVTQRLRNTTTRLAAMRNSKQTQAYGAGLIDVKSAVSS